MPGLATLMMQTVNASTVFEGLDSTDRPMSQDACLLRIINTGSPHKRLQSRHNHWHDSLQLKLANGLVKLPAHDRTYQVSS